MKNLKIYIQRWQQLQQRSETLEQDRNTFCRDLRAEFEPGRSGDMAFQTCCMNNLNVPAVVARDLLLRAIAGAAFTSESELRTAGGLAAIALIADKPPEEREKLLLKSKTLKVKLYSLVRPRAKTKVKVIKKVEVSKDDHLKVLSAFVLASKDAPVKLREIASLYAKPPVSTTARPARRVVQA